jgi:hypothetical protein
MDDHADATRCYNRDLSRYTENTSRIWPESPVPAVYGICLPRHVTPQPTGVRDGPFRALPVPNPTD